MVRVVPYAKMKVKIYESQDGAYTGRTDLMIKGKLDEQLQIVKSPNSNTDNYSYDGINRLTHIYNSNTKEYDEYRYDLANNTTFARGKGASATTYSYDKTNNQTLENSSVRNTINYTYDEAGNLIKETNAKGNITQYRYDAINCASSDLI